MSQKRNGFSQKSIFYYIESNREGVVKISSSYYYYSCYYFSRRKSNHFESFSEFKTHTQSDSPLLCENRKK